MMQSLLCHCCCTEGSTTDPNDQKVPLQLTAALRDSYHEGDRTRPLISHEAYDAFRPSRMAAKDRDHEAEPEVHGTDTDDEGTFNVELNLEGDLKVGLGIRMVPELGVLRVEVLQDQGAASVWNLANPHAMVQKGDHIVQVNDKRNDLRLMVRECSRSRRFVLKCKRPPK